jgi:hypothetical protein
MEGGMLKRWVGELWYKEGKGNAEGEGVGSASVKELFTPVSK